MLPGAMEGRERRGLRRLRLNSCRVYRVQLSSVDPPLVASYGDTMEQHHSSIILLSFPHTLASPARVCHFHQAFIQHLYSLPPQPILSQSHLRTPVHQLYYQLLITELHLHPTIIGEESSVARYE